MTDEPRTVLDTNVVISAALLAGSLPARVLRHVVRHGRIVFSEPTFAELEQRLWRPKFDRYVTIERRRSLLHDLAAVAEWVPAAALQALASRRFSRDASDDMFVQCALAGHATLIVTGDKDLLALDAVESVAIRSPSAAWAAWKGAGDKG
jgi:putative PIN family toxin of toxin-antitoxin system